ncbi:MAG TPA: response regulator [Fibrobacteria bacterium]|nr:response regulator [Fibrobacteria bacterium]
MTASMGPASEERPEDGTITGSGSRSRGITVLLVDDDVSVRALVEAALEIQGYSILKAYDSDQALRLSDAHEGPIQLLIADQVMPPFMSGNELASCLRLMRPEIKVLYISGYAANDSVQDEVGDFAADFLPKPFTPDLLIRKVEKLVAMNSGAE